MTGMDLFNIAVGILGIISFVFSIWIWMRSDMKIREMSGAIDTVRDIAGSAIWEWQAGAENSEAKIQRAEKIMGYVSSIQKVSNRYLPKNKREIAQGQLGQLIERGVILTGLSYDDLEMSKEITEVWTVTPDLKPDSSDEVVGKLVNRNLKAGKKYVFFYPDDLPHAEAEIAALFKNLGVNANSKPGKNIRLIPLSRTKHANLFASGGNMTLYFRDENRSLAPRSFEEIVLSQVPERGSFWQEHSEERAKQLRFLLENESEIGPN